MRSRLVSVLGGSQAAPEEETQAEEVGRLLASAGFTLVCGGGSGVMEAACRGARTVGGDTIAILQGTDTSEANPFVTTALATGMGSSRNRIIALSGEVIVAVGGGFGTLSEIAFALQAGRPVCALGRWGTLEGVSPVHTPGEAMEFVIRNTGGGSC
jgi:uncharacterized protein (TIGR00725 family)